MNALQRELSALHAIVKILERERTNTLFNKLSDKDKEMFIRAVQTHDIQKVLDLLQTFQVRYSNYLFMSIRELRLVANKRRISYQRKKKMDLILDLLAYDEEC